MSLLVFSNFVLKSFSDLPIGISAIFDYFGLHDMFLIFLFSIIDGTQKQKINKGTENLTNTANQVDPINHNKGILLVLLKDTGNILQDTPYVKP